MNSSSLPNGIEKIVEIQDSSFYLFLGAVFGFTVFLIFLIRILWKLFRKKENKREEYLKILHNLDWNNPKETAYKITKYGRLVAKERGEKLLKNLNSKLESYKYKPTVSKISDEVQREFYLFLEVVESE